MCRVDQRLALEGGLHNCDLTIQGVRRQDHGDWTCIVADGENFEQVRSNIDLEVGVAADVAFDPGFGVNNELTITEGEEAKVGQPRRLPLSLFILVTDSDKHSQLIGHHQCFILGGLSSSQK